MNARVAEFAAIAQVVGSVGMFGVIWIVQLVHYPLMRYVSEQEFPRFETEHRVRISWVVGPLMLVEGLCALAVVFAPPTVAISAPLHERLNAHFDPALLNRLVATNWIRTVAWTARAGLAIAILVAVLR